MVKQSAEQNFHFFHDTYLNFQKDTYKQLFLYELALAMAIEKFPYIFKKSVKLLLALMKRNQISTWAMWKSDFRMAHVEIRFLFISASNNFTNFLNKNLKIAWLTHTGIQFPNGPWFSGMKISSSRGLKN